MEHQDWSTVEFRNKFAIDDKTKLLNNKKRSISERLSKLDNDNENFNHKMIEKSTSNRIIQARVNLKLNRKQLAIKCNLKEQDITDIENGKILASDCKINKVLKIMKI
jgi:ribosome-binding protein aMBF1 (putative translation factor)